MLRKIPRRIACMFDRIQDRWQLGSYSESRNRFKILSGSRPIQAAGGGANALNNLSSIIAPAITIPLSTNNIASTITRYIDANDGNVVIEIEDVYETKAQQNRLRPPIGIPPTGVDIMISDYNKGSCTNLTNQDIVWLSRININTIVFDSRYRTVDTRFFAKAKNIVWRCTGLEFNHDWAASVGVQWVVHSDGPNLIRIFNLSHPNDMVIVYPLRVEVIDPVGAGDTMTAAISAALACVDEITLDTLKLALEFAVECCAEVVQYKHIAVTTKRVEEFEKRYAARNETETKGE